MRKLLLKIGFGKGPVYKVPELLYIGRSGITVVNIIGMFPYITGQQRDFLISYGSACIARTYYD